MKTQIVKSPSKHHSTEAIVGALINHQNVISDAAKQLGITSVTLKKYLKKQPAIQEMVDERDQILCDQARTALSAALTAEVPSEALIKFTLERLDPKFQKVSVNKQNVHITGDPSAPVSFSNAISVEGLSLEEKKILMKAAKKELGIDTDDGNTIDISPLAVDDSAYSFIEAEEIIEEETDVNELD